MYIYVYAEYPTNDVRDYFQPHFAASGWIQVDSIQTGYEMASILSAAGFVGFDGSPKPGMYATSKPIIPNDTDIDEILLEPIFTDGVHTGFKEHANA